MDPDDLKWIGKGKITDPVKIDINGISESINNYINATHVPPVLEPTLRAYASLPKEKILSFNCFGCVSKTVVLLFNIEVKCVFPEPEGPKILIIFFIHFGQLFIKSYAS